MRERPEPEAAAEAAGRVLAYLPEVRSDRLLQQLQNVESALQRHAAVPAVADRLEEYRTTTGVSQEKTVSTPNTRTDLVIRTYGPGQVSPLLDLIADIWADAHPEFLDNPAAEGSGLSLPALRRQVQGHLKHAGFALVVA